MKIVQVTGYFNPNYYSSNELFLSRELTKLRHKVVVFTTTRQPKWQTIEDRWGKNTVERVDGFVVKRLSIGLEIGTVPLVPMLLPALISEEFDVIHSHDFFTTFSFYSAVASKTQGKPLIVTQHNDQFPSSVLSHFLYKFVLLTLGKYVLRRANKIIALTKDIKLHLMRVGVHEDKIEIVPNAVDTKRFSPENKNLLQDRWGITSPVILFVGRLVPEKGVEYLLLAFSLVVKTIPEAKLVILGVGPKEQELRKLQGKLGIPNVFFLGAVENAIMPNVYAGADVVVLPSIREPFGNVVIEAMASGKPVIGSYVGGMKDSIVHGITGYHVEPGNSKQICEFLLEVLLHRTLQEHLGKNARERATNIFSQKILIEKIMKIYQSTASRA